MATEPNPRATIRDVARAASVSVTTASNALNASGRVGAGTRDRVERAAQRLGYSADRAARALRSGRSDALGLLLPYGAEAPEGSGLLGVDYYLDLAGAVAEHAFKRDRTLVLVPFLRGEAEARRFPVDGAIVVDPVPGDRSPNLLDRLDVPVVTVDRASARPEDNWWVASDNAANTRALLEHLAAAGAKRVALLSGAARWSWLEESEAAYERWVAERGRPAIVARLPHVADAAGAIRATAELLAADAPPDAILALPERAAPGALAAARGRGLRVPENILIAAGVDSRGALAAEPPITAMDLRPAAVAESAVELLLARIDGREVARPQLVGSELRIRRSSARGGG